MSLTRKGYRPAPRWEWSRQWGKLLVEVRPHINQECVAVGACINWNFKPSFELEFLLWTLYVEWGKQR